MRAAVYEALGSPDVLHVVDLDRPDPGPGEVRVRMVVSAVNPTDCKSRSGATATHLSYPFVVPHHDGAGVIDAVGTGVDDLRIGERVWVFFAARNRQFGTASQWACIPSRQAIALPADCTWELGASLGIPALTAHCALFVDGPIEGRTVLVAGGAGAVGHFAIQLAVRAGARVLSTVSSDDKAALARAAGAHAVVNYRQQEAAVALRQGAPKGIDRVIEVDLATNVSLDLEVTAIGATIVIYASTASDPVVPVRACMNRSIALRFLLLYLVAEDVLSAAVHDVSEALAEGRLTELPVVHFPLEQIADAHRAVEANAVGKIMVDL